jgi:hypothetical protein
MSRLSRQCGILTSHNPIGLQGLLRDSFTFTFTLCYNYVQCRDVIAALQFWFSWIFEVKELLARFIFLLFLEIKLFLFKCCSVKGRAPPLESLYLRTRFREESGVWESNSQRFATGYVKWKENYVQSCSVSRKYIDIYYFYFQVRAVAVILRQWNRSYTVEEWVTSAVQVHVRSQTGALDLWHLAFGISEKMLSEIIPPDKLSRVVRDCHADSNVSRRTPFTTKVSTAVFS